jgi:hypothetical protein
MSNDAPTSFTNLTDALFTADAFRGVAAHIGFVFQKNLRFVVEKLLAIAAGDSVQNYPHYHGEQSAIESVTVRRSVYSKFLYDNTNEHITLATIPTGDWTTIHTFRYWTGGFKGLACEVEFYNGNSGTSSILWNFRHADGTDGGSDGGTDHSIVETSGTDHAAWAWHTINGQLDAAGGNVKTCTVDGPTSVTDPGDTASWRTCRVQAKAVTATCDLYVRNIHVWERLTTD